MKKQIFILALLVTIVKCTSLVAQNGYNIGDKIDAFSTKDQNNLLWNSNNYIGNKNVVIYFYPAAMTGGCTKQACAYRDDKEDLTNLNAIIVGISGDAPENLKLFQTAHNLNFTLLSDSGGLIAKQFGVPVKEGVKSIDRTINGTEFTLNRTATTSRWTFIINQSGKVIFKSDKVNAANDSKSVIQALKSNQ